MIFQEYDKKVILGISSELSLVIKIDFHYVGGAESI